MQLAKQENYKKEDQCQVCGFNLNIFVVLIFKVKGSLYGGIIYLFYDNLDASVLATSVGRFQVGGSHKRSVLQTWKKKLVF